MDIKKIKSGSWRQGYKYNYFLPEKINHEFTINDSKTQKLLERASFRLGELNAYARLTPDIDMLDLIFQSNINICKIFKIKYLSKRA